MRRSAPLAALALLAALGLAAVLTPSCTLARPLDGIACPQDMVSIDGLYCIDAHVVTNGQFRAFVAAGPNLSNLPPACSEDFSLDFDTGGNCPTRHQEDGAPATCLNWCQAYVYCQNQGKRLCGRIGGGSLAPDAGADPSQSEWYRACSARGTLKYATGMSFDEDHCNGGSQSQCQDGPTSPAAAAGACPQTDLGDCNLGAGTYVCPAPCDLGTGSTASCQSPMYPGLYDMSGNVTEWEDSCLADQGGDDHCIARGGSFASQCDPQELACAYADKNPVRSGSLPTLGFRCCEG